MKLRGFALVSVLWIVLVGGLLASVFALRAGSIAETARLELDQLDAVALAETGFTRAIWVLLGDDLLSLRADGLVWRETRQSGGLAVRIVAADGLIDLNFASAEIIQRLSETVVELLDHKLTVGVIKRRLAAGQGNFSSSLDFPLLFSDVIEDRDLSYKLAGLVTVGSGRQTPHLDQSPEDILRLIARLTEVEFRQAQRERRNAKIESNWTFEPSTRAQGGALTEGNGKIWHVSFAGKSGAAKWGQTRIFYLGPISERMSKPYLLLESLHLSAEDPLWAAFAVESQKN